MRFARSEAMMMMKPDLKIGRRSIAIREYANEVHGRYLEAWRSRHLYEHTTS
jgi:hypothetical protein